LLGDLAAQNDQLEEARQRYDAALALPLEESAGRLLSCKRLALDEQNAAVRQQLISFLVEPTPLRDVSIDLDRTRKLSALAPESALLRYLLARQLEMRGLYQDALSELARALQGELPDERFVREALRLSGIAAFRLGRFSDAHEHFLWWRDLLPE